MVVRKIGPSELLVPFGTSNNSNHSVLEVVEVLNGKIKCRCPIHFTKFTLFLKDEIEHELLQFILVQEKIGCLGVDDVLKIKSTNSKNVWKDETDYDAFENCIIVALKPFKVPAV